MGGKTCVTRNCGYICFYTSFSKKQKNKQTTTKEKNKDKPKCIAIKCKLFFKEFVIENLNFQGETPLAFSPLNPKAPSSDQELNTATGIDSKHFVKASRF